MNIGIVIAEGLLILSLILIIRNLNVYITRDKILKAMNEYRYDCRLNKTKSEVCYDDMNNYYIDILRFWTWTHKGRLPKDKYDIIKEYI